jgi:NADPH:quinone reductase-like Zn-dependent oxidoreductase
VVGTASHGKLAVVRSLGAELAVDNRDASWPMQVRDAVGAVDVVIDPVGDAVFAGSWKLLGFEGRYVSVGFTSGGIPSVPANEALVRNLSLHGMYWTPYATARPDSSSGRRRDLPTPPGGPPRPVRDRDRPARGCARVRRPGREGCHDRQDRVVR